MNFWKLFFMYLSRIFYVCLHFYSVIKMSHIELFSSCVNPELISSVLTLKIK